MEIHCCHWWVVFFFSSKHGPKPRRSPCGLTQEEDMAVCFLWMHMWTQQRQLGFPCPAPPPAPPSFSFHFPRYTQSSDIHHLPYQFFKKKILMLHIRHGYLPTNTFGNWAAPILCVFPQGRSPVARAGDSCSRLLGQHVHLQRGNTPQGLLLFWGPQEAHHFMKLTPSPSRKRLLQTDV